MVPRRRGVRPGQRDLDRDRDDGQGSALADSPPATLLRRRQGPVTGLDDAQLYDPASGTWTATGKMNITRGYGPRPRCCPTARCSWRAATVDLPATTTRRTRPRSTTPSRGPGPRSRTCTRRARAQGGLAAARWQGAGGTAIRIPRDLRPGHRNLDRTPCATRLELIPAALLSDGTVLMAGRRWHADQQTCTAAALYDPRTGSLTTASSMLRCADALARSRSCSTARSSWQVAATVTATVSCVSTGAAELYVPAGVPLPPLPAFPSPPPPVFPSPTPVPTPLPPADGPVPPNARSWTVTVDNKSSEPATLFVAGGRRV